MELNKEEVTGICEEIELQWGYHLLTRAVFYSKFPEKDEYTSPDFYQDRGIKFHVSLPENKSELFNTASQGIQMWLNQNYVIRLFGILNKKKLLKYGKENKIDIIVLIDLLRNEIGAHQSGRRVRDRGKLKKATKLINDLFDQELDIEDVGNYLLAVDNVLEPMKNKVTKFIKEFEK